MYKILKNIIEMDDYSVQKLSKSQPPEPFQWNTVEGTELNVSDCIGGKGKIEVKGNTYQKQLSGKNLYGINDYEGTFKNVTIKIKDGEMTLNGTANGTGTLYIEPKNEQIFDGTYTIVKNLISGTQTGSGNINLRNANDDTVIDGTQLSLGDNIRTFTINNTSIKYGIYLMNGVTFNNFKIRPQIVVGNTPDYDFEQYCGGQPSPNPDYPQEIKVVTGDNVVKHVGKNLFVGYDNMLNGFLPIANSYPTVNSSYPNARYQILELKAGESITTTIDANYSEGRIRAIDAKTNKIISSIEIVENDYYSTTETYAGSFRAGTITAKKDLLIGVMLLKRPTIDLSFQIEYGNTPTPYEPYREEEYKLDLWKENEFDINDVNKLNAYIDSSNKITSSEATRTLYVECKKNTLYKISKAKSARFRAMYTTDTPAINRVGNGYIVNDTGEEIIIKTGNNAKYLCVFYYHANQDTLTEQAILESIQIQEAIELCKIDDYQDIPFKNVVGDENYNAELEEGAWYKKSAIAEVVLDGRETWNYNSGNRYFFTNKFLDNYVTQYTKLVSNNYIGGMASNGGLYNNHIQTGTAYSFMLCDNRFTDKNDLKTWLSTHNTIVKYPLATPTYEKITDPTLISQLEALNKAKWFKGVNHWWTETDNLDPVLAGTYKQSIQSETQNSIANLQVQANEQSISNTPDLVESEVEE
jgi:hypothetical protein